MLTIPKVVSLLVGVCIFTVHGGLMGFASAQETSADAVEEREPVSFPATEIFLFEIDLDASENVLGGGTNVTQRKGYDNQPFFTPKGKSFIYSRDDGYQTDVYEYFIKSGETVRLTESDATEFSPTPFPDNSAISFVSDRTSSIWFGSRDDLNNPEVAQKGFSNTEPVGYYAWNHTTGDILYWSQFGYSLSLVHESEAQYHFVTGHAVPATPHVIPGTNKFSFVHRQTNEQVWIKELDPETKAVRPIAPLIGSNANYVWFDAQTILLIENNTLYKYTTTDSEWSELADFSDHAIKGAYRLAVSKKHLAVVGNVVEN